MSRSSAQVFDSTHISIGRSLRDFWKRERVSLSWLATAEKVTQVGWEFLRGSLPERRRQRYGDVDYDWEFRVDTTSATLGWRTRLLGLLHSEYQAIEPELFRQIMASLEIEFSRFTFLDIGSGKGRALLLAAEYPFHRVMGIELLPELNSVAKENIRKFSSQQRVCRRIQALSGDATTFILPAEPLLIFLFHPLPDAGLKKLVGNLDASLRELPRPVYVIYVNPILEEILRSSSWLAKIGGTHQYSVFRS